MTTLTGTTFYMKQTGSTIQRSTDNATWTTVSSWPVRLATANATLTFTTDLSFNSISQYFVIGNTNQTIDGSYNIVYLDGLAGYRGLVKNGNYAYSGGVSLTYGTPSTAVTTNTGYLGSTLKNIFCYTLNNSMLGAVAETNTSTASTIQFGNGWLCQIYYGNRTSGHNIINCGTNGSNITKYWYNWSNSTGNVVTTHTANLYTVRGGLLIGDRANINAYKCFSTGSLVNNGGGIFGTYAIASAICCYSTGGRTGGNGSDEQNMGGIFGFSGTNSATSCYSNNTLGYGINADTIANCYCYSSAITGSTVTKSYSSASSWSDTTAISSLDNSANTWTDINLNSTSVAWRLSDFSYNFYGSSSGTNVATQPASLTGIFGGTYTYSIISISVNSGTAVASYSGISINSSTGALSFSGLSVGTYEVKVMAENSITAGYLFTTFTNTVASTNNAPTITSGATASVSENISSSTTVYTVTATDADAGNTLTYSISGGADSSLFNIGSSTGIVTFKASPNYESPTDSNTDNVYNITVAVSDGTATTTQAVAITVTNVNETAIITGTSTGSITETNATQSVSGALSISDPDVGQSAFVPRTDVSGNNQYGKFSIDASGSWSYTMNSPHDEFVSGQYYMDSITVTSVDSTASQVITVTILGTNDVPIITGTSTGSLTETNVTQSITGSLSISDDPDSETTYFIPQTDVSGNNQYGKFTIDTSGNWTYTMNSPHNEFAGGETYTDSIIVYSNDGSASQAITVTMTGINDAPVITSEAFERTSNSIGTSTVYTVTAVDPDINASLTYSISGTDASFFNINETSGAISFKTTPSPRVYSITVGVSDGSLSATKNVVVMVTSSSVANYPLITANQTSITTSSVIYGDITVSNLNIASGVEIYLASGSTMTALSGSFQGNLTGGGNLLKSGTGELTLSSSNTDFTGVLKVTEGTVKIQTADALGSGSVELGTSTSSGSATLKFDFSGPTSITNDIVASSTGENLVENTSLYTLTLSGNVTKDGTTLTLSGDIEVSGTIEGSSANSDVIVSGDTVYTSSSTTDYNGPTTIQDGGTLTLQNGVSIPNSDVTVESGGLFIIQNTSMPASVTANSVTLESNSMMNLNSGYLKTNSLTISNTSSGGYASINLVPGNSAIIETGDLTISTMLAINITDALTSGSYDLIQWTGTSVVTGSVIVYYSGVSTVSISGAFNYTSKKYTITVTPATSSTTYTVGGTISGNSTEVVLKLNGTTDTLTIASGQTDAAFTFSTGLTSGTSYTVTVYSYSSSTQSYVLNYSTGTISSSNISNVSLVFSDVTNPDGNICFPANTPVLTNLGYIPIDKIDPSIHHIRNKKIIAVTKTVTNDKHLVRIGKNALGQHYPSKAVYSSRNHKVFYKGKMIKAKHLVELVENVSLVPYNGEPLYNILLEEHEKMQVNNLIVETLHPEHKVAKLYIILGMLSPAEQVDLIRLYNKYDREYRPVANK